MPLLTLCIPTLNPGALAQQMVAALKAQTLQPDEILVIDSASTDGSIGAYSEIGARIIPILRKDFDHGGTRNIAFEQSVAEIYIFMTQDAIPTEIDALKNLVSVLQANEQCGLAYGRQTPSPSAGVFARHARLYNYPAEGGGYLRVSMTYLVWELRRLFAPILFPPIVAVRWKKLVFFRSIHYLPRIALLRLSFCSVAGRWLMFPTQW